MKKQVFCIFALIAFVIFALAACQADISPQGGTVDNRLTDVASQSSDLNSHEIISEDYSLTEEVRQPDESSHEAISEDYSSTEDMSQTAEYTERVDIQTLLRKNFDEVRQLFGWQTDYSTSPFHDYIYSFDTGVSVGIGYSHLRGISLINVNYLCSDNWFHHFAGIDGTSTRDEVIERFGNPESTRSSDSEEYRGASVSYLYWAGQNEAVRFFFDTEENVVAISLFLAET